MTASAKSCIVSEASKTWEHTVNVPYRMEELPEISEKYRRMFSRGDCQVYYLAYEPTGDLSGPEADFRKYYFWIQALDRSEFQLTMLCGFSRFDEAFDPEVFLEDHIMIEEK